MRQTDKRQTQSTAAQRSSHPLIALAVAATFVVAAAPSDVRAACVAQIATDAASAAVSSVSDVFTAGLTITESYYDLIDNLTRLANQVNQDNQKRNEVESGLVDSEVTSMTSAAIAETRADMAPKFVPSAVVCADATAAKRLDTTKATYAAYRTARQTANTGWSNNTDAGSKTGTLGAVAAVWKDRCDKYANPDNLGSPSGCSGPVDTEMRDLDVEPWRALLDPVAFKDTTRETAAADAIRMLTDVTPSDPVRGNALLRTEGKNLHVLKMRDTTRMNLARAVLEDIAAMRVVKSGETHSRLARYLELVQGRTYDPTSNTLSGTLPAVMASSEPGNAAVQTVSSRVATQQALIFEIMRVTEQLVAVEAVDLAIKTERNRSGGAATRAIGAN